MSDIKKQIFLNSAEVYGKIIESCKKAGRKPESVILTAISKKHSTEKMNAYFDYCSENGIQVVYGENYVKEYAAKKDYLKKPFQAHFTGLLQSNKAKESVFLFDVIQTVHSEKIARILNKEAYKIRKIQKIFLQVNISEDPLKGGFSASEAEDFISNKIAEFPNLSLCGLMTITKDYEIAEEVRNDYRNLRILRDGLCSGNSYIRNKLALSMGMSHDYNIAIEEGADYLRIGTAVFGEREPDVSL